MTVSGRRAGALAMIAMFAGWSACAVAQDAASVPAAAPVALANVAPAPAHLIPKLTPVTIEILEPLGSKLSKSLQTFRIALKDPIVVDGVELVPAGTSGMGEVVHAKKAGGMGAAGELVLAARYLDVGGQQLRLRSMLVDADGVGQSRVNTVNAINTASAAALPMLSVVGFFIKGGNIEVPAGQIATAKLAADFTVAQPAAADMAKVAAVAVAPQTNTAPEGVGTDRTEGN